MKVQVEIEIPDDCEICKGPVFSSALWNDSIRERPETGVICFHVVVGRAWQWPSWLKVSAVAMDKCGDWWAFNTIPTLHQSTHEWIGECAFELIGDEVDFSPPPCDDWKQSLRINPNREATP